MSVTIYLANKGFSLPVGPSDTIRRRAYFANKKDPNNQLKPEELDILAALGIDITARDCFDKDMPAFFDQLENCQSDSSLVLSKQCELVHHILWQSLFYAQQYSKERYDLNLKTKKPLADLSVAINDAVLNDLQPVREDLNDIDRLFTLLFKADMIPTSDAVGPVLLEGTSGEIERLFTLIIDGVIPPMSSPAVTAVPAVPAVP